MKDQTSASENGIYIVQASPARDDLFDTYDEYPGSLIVISEGTVNNDTIYICTSNAGGTLDSTSIAWAQVTPAATGLNNLTDVTLSSPSSGQALTYNGSAWVNGSGGGGLFKGENGQTGSSAGDIFRLNEAELNTSTTIDSDENGSATGPLAIASGVTLTVSGNLAII